MERFYLSPLFYFFIFFIDLSEVTWRLEQKDLQAPFRTELIPVSGSSEERMEKNVGAHF